MDLPSSRLLAPPSPSSFDVIAERDDFSSLDVAVGVEEERDDAVSLRCHAADGDVGWSCWRVDVAAGKGAENAWQLVAASSPQAMDEDALAIFMLLEYIMMKEREKIYL